MASPQTVIAAKSQDSAMLTATSCVFTIPELFEAILAQLSIRDLLLSQLVSAGWASTISSSPALQQKLFFTPTSSNPSRKADPEINTLLSSLFPPFFSHPEDGDGTENCRALYPMCSQPWFVDEARRAKVLREEASWRKMYPIQPARMVGKVEARGGCGCGTMEIEVWGVKAKFMGRATGLEGGEAASGNGGTTMGFLYDLIVWIADEWPEVEFWVDLGVPWSDSSSDGSSEHSVNGDEQFEDDAVTGSGGGAKEEEGYDTEGPETGPFRTLIMHSQSCYTTRGKKFAPSGLMVHGFEEDPIELLESNKQR
ncbi:hypothetical protein DL98DRAFT_517475 [Cadophora sp. DSE1049]|nr:hypothetical protein DL98DRAFT_517475 [Cadophora sp. DSE1049]